VLTLGTGDLGSTAAEVEEALERNFALANRWGCIVLIDEADVFVGERTREDFLRNSIVAGSHQLSYICLVPLADTGSSISPGPRVLLWSSVLYY